MIDPHAGYQELVERIPAVVYLADVDEYRSMRYVSPQIEALLGRPAEAFVADADLWYDVIHPDDTDRVRAAARAAFRTGAELDCEFRMVAADGRVVHVWERDAILHDAHGAPLLTQGVLVDVTDRRRTEDALREERDRFQTYLDVAGTLVVAVDASGRSTMVNRATHELLGYDEGTLLGIDFFERCLPVAHRAHLRARFDELLAADAILPQAEAELLCRDGSVRTVAWHTTVLREAGRPVGILSSGIDITDRLRAEQQVAHLAYHDGLTGLPNRSLLQEHLEAALARGRRHRHSVALLYLDLDDFKLVNDGLGHAAGDELLCQVAARLRRHVRETDTLARQGGDEFLILLPDLEGEAEARAEVAARHVVDAIRQPFRIGGTEFEIGGSVGISVFPTDANDADTLLEHADAAMYEAKAAGRGEIRVHRGSQPRRGLERLALSRRLRLAIAAGDLTLHWQPIVTLVDGALAGAEALVRWEDPEHGLRGAAEFVPVAEHSGVLNELDEWVVAAFSAQRRSWRAAGLNPYVGFNLSPRQLRPERVDALLQGLRTGGDLAHVTIELTEGVALRGDPTVPAALHALRDAGVTLALDDFGVAYSSLSRLADLPVDWVKVDRSFLRGVPDQAVATRLLASILALVEALEMGVIVEGVETPAHEAYLIEQGCGLAQGFGLGQPMPAAQLERLMRPSPASRDIP